MPDTMNAVVVEEYGDIKKLVSKKVPKPGPPEGHDILVECVLLPLPLFRLPSLIPTSPN